MEMTTEKANQVKMLISYFNFCAGTKYKFAVDRNQEAASYAIDACGGDIKGLKMHLKQFALTNNSFVSACYAYRKQEEAQVELEVTKEVTKESAVAPQQTQPHETNLGTSLDFIGKVVVEMLAKTKLEDVQNAVVSKANEEVKKFIAETYGPIQRKIELKVGDRQFEFKGVLHEKFDEVLKLVNDDIPVFLTGPAGSGKNVICKQVAEALGLKFYFSNAVTQEYKITGFTDAMGVFQESQFYKAFKDGGVFMLDEMDASIPEVLIILNAAISNRYFDFPAPIGYVEAHPNFRVVAAGNTFGEGADSSYVGRNQLDAASLNRFFPVRIEYDSRIEEYCADGDENLLSFVRAFRKAVNKAGINTVISYRNISMLSRTSRIIGMEDAIRGSLVKALGKDDLNIIKEDVQGYEEYSTAFNKVLRQM